MEDIRLYDEAKKEDDGERILLSDYVWERGNNELSYPIDQAFKLIEKARKIIK